MYTQVRKNLFLVETQLPQEVKAVLASVKEKTNHVFIFDRSGSMSWTLRELIEDLIKQAQSLPDGSTFTAGWFSSQREFGWICKGLSVSENRDAIPAMLRKYNNTVGMTCYSEILDDTKKVVSDLSAISKNNAFAFFSDGFPNQSVDSIIGICKSLAPLMSSAMLVGYGNWYGRDFMTGMAQALGGILVHSSNIAEFSKSYASFREGNENLQPRVEFKVPADAKEFITTIDKNGDVITHSIEDSTLFLSPDTTSILYFADKAPKTKKFDSESILPAIYATARSSSQVGNPALALELLGVIGDVKYIDNLNNSCTIGEYGKIEAELLEAVSDENMRFVRGQKDNYVPKDDAFCGLELMEALTKDETIELLPKHPAFVYRKISRATKSKNPDLRMEVDKGVGIKLSNLVWSSDALNLSVGAKTPGIVELDKDANKFGFDQQFHATKFNTYTFIHDGKWNIEELPLRNLSPETQKLVEKHELVVSKNGVTVIDPRKLPVINRKIAASYTDLDAICEKLKQEIVLEARQKVFKEFYNRLPEELREQTESFVKPTDFTPEQVEYLWKFGVKKDGSFSPESETLPVSDAIPITKISFAVKGFSSLPAVSKVEEKLAEKKKLTPSEQAVAEAMEFYTLETFKMKTDKQKALYLKESAEQIRKDLFSLRSELNRAKFAVVLGKGKFKQLPKLDDGDNPYTYQGQTYLIKINTKAVVEI